MAINLGKVPFRVFDDKSDTSNLVEENDEKASVDVQKVVQQLQQTKMSILRRLILAVLIVYVTVIILCVIKYLILETFS